MSPVAALGTITGIFVAILLMLLVPKFLGWVLVTLLGLGLFILFAYLLFQALTGKNIVDYFKELN